jgi:hypothetical protein
MKLRALSLSLAFFTVLCVAACSPAAKPAEHPQPPGEILNELLLPNGVINTALTSLDAPAGFHDGVERNSCGQLTLQQGQKISAVAIDCINAARSTTAAQLVVVSPTTEGDPIVNIYRTDVGVAGVKVFIDNEFDRWGAPGWNLRLCELAASTNFLIGCAEL